MAISKPVFVLITSDGCPACHVFRSTHLESVKSRILSEGRVEYVEINSPTMSAHAGSSYHPDLVRYIQWFPTFFLFTADSWNNKNGKLVGKIFNGKLENGIKGLVAEPIKPGIHNRDANGISKWINDCLDEDMFLAARHEDIHQNSQSYDSINPRNQQRNMNNQTMPRPNMNNSGSYRVNVVNNDDHHNSGLPRFGVAPPRNPNIGPHQFQRSQPVMSPRLPPPATPRLQIPVQTPIQMNGRSQHQSSLRLPPIENSFDSWQNSSFNEQVGSSSRFRDDTRYEDEVATPRTNGWGHHQGVHSTPQSSRILPPRNGSSNQGNGTVIPGSRGLTDHGTPIRYEHNDIPFGP